MYVARHAASTKITEDGQREHVAHRIDVEIRREGRERLPAQEERADALAQQGEVGIETGLHEKPMFQKDEANWTWQADVKAATSTIHDLLARNTLITCVDDEIYIFVPAVKQWDTELNTLIILMITSYWPLRTGFR